MVMFFGYQNMFLVVLLSALVGAALVYCFFRFIKKDIGKASGVEDMKPSEDKEIIMGLKENAASFADLLEPMYILSKGSAGRKDAIFDAWNSRVAGSGASLEFKNAFVSKFGYIEKWKGKDKKYIGNAKKLIKYADKAGIKRSEDKAIQANETTPYKYVMAGSTALESGATYDVLAPFWYNDTEVLCRGVIR